MNFTNHNTLVYYSRTKVTGGSFGHVQALFQLYDIYLTENVSQILSR